MPRTDDADVLIRNVDYAVRKGWQRCSGGTATVVGEIEPRQVLILVEWKSRAHFDGYREDPELDRLEDLRPLLKRA